MVFFVCSRSRVSRNFRLLALAFYINNRLFLLLSSHSATVQRHVGEWTCQGMIRKNMMNLLKDFNVFFSLFILNTYSVNDVASFSFGWKRFLELKICINPKWWCGEYASSRLRTKACGLWMFIVQVTYVYSIRHIILMVEINTHTHMYFYMWFWIEPSASANKEIAKMKKKKKQKQFS